MLVWEIFKVGIFAQQEPASAGHALQTLVGHYMQISLTTKTTNFLEGTNCKQGQLEFFKDYTRDACKLEQLYKDVIAKCGCYPYLIADKDIVNRTKYKGKKLFEALQI